MAEWSKGGEIFWYETISQWSHGDPQTKMYFRSFSRHQFEGWF